MTLFSVRSDTRAGICFFLVLLCWIALLIPPVSAYGYSENYEGYLGETIALHGVSYNSDQVYLFMTGPGLPENGVALTNPSKQAVQGFFTTIDVSSNQEWSFKWDTSRIENQIDPGTYTVYVVNVPVDKSGLDGHSYQTLTVYLKDGNLSKDRISVGAKYTLNLADDDTVIPTTRVTTVPPTSLPTTVNPDTTMTTAVSTPLPTKKSALPPGIAVPVLVVAGYFCIRRQDCR